MSAWVYFMKTVNGCNNASVISLQDEWYRLQTDMFTLFVYCNFLVLLSTPLCSQNINKQNVNIADETLTDYSFRSRYHNTKSKNYLKRRYRIRHWIPMFSGTPCRFYTTKYLLIEWNYDDKSCCSISPDSTYVSPYLESMEIKDINTKIHLSN